MVPRALAAWSLVFLAGHILSAVGDLAGLIAQAPALLVAAIGIGAIWRMHSTLHAAFDFAAPTGPDGPDMAQGDALWRRMFQLVFKRVSSERTD